LSVGKSRWAKIYYDEQLARGKSPQMAKRALAYKWIRIIFRCGQQGEAYDEARYIQPLTLTHSPLAEKLVA
jgi:hypothetical protein